MARWRPRRTLRLHAALRGIPRPVAVPSRHADHLSRDLDERWTALHRHCSDESSHVRLGRLIHRLEHGDPGVRESALAELELAMQLIRVGARVVFLPESQARTADFECRLAGGRFFVEVTAMVGSAERRRLPIRGLLTGEGQPEEEDRGVILTHRILARVQQKARQLADYCDPVILYISIPRADLRSGTRSRREEIWLDLKALSGAVTVLLTRLPHVTAVLMSLWDVHPLPATAATRLANVDIAQRSKQERSRPRVRMLVFNPGASASLAHLQADAIRGVL